MACPHEDFESSVVVTRVSQPEGIPPAYVVAVRVRCEACQIPVVFALPLAVGQGFIREVEQSADGTEARLRAQIATAATEVPGGWTRTQTVTTDEG